MKTKLLYIFAHVVFWAASSSVVTGQTPDSSFVSPAFLDVDGQVGYVQSLTVQPDGKMLAFGSFTNVGGQPHTNLVRLNTDGPVDGTFNPPYIENVTTVVLQANGKALAGGRFTSVAGQPRTNLAALNLDGTLDTEFNPIWPKNNLVLTSLAVQVDDKVLVGTANTDYSLGAPIYRLNPDGTCDNDFIVQGGIFNSGPIAVQAAGKILLGRGSSWEFGRQSALYRLNPDGSLDRAFDIAGRVNELLVQADGRILIGGSFTNVAGQPQTNVARLNVDGTLDSSFALESAGSIDSWIALQADGEMLVNYSFVAPDGQRHGGLARLNANGSLDGSFSIIEDVFGLAMQRDGKILVFTGTGLARLNNTGPATQSLTFQGSTITWLRGGTSPEVSQTLFQSSTNGALWTQLGEGQRIAGGWQLANVSVETGATIRALGLMASGGIVESKLVVAPPPVIVATDPLFGVHSNRFGFNISGLAGQVIVVEASTNLQQWIALQTNTLTGDLLYFADSDWWQNARQFYRVRVN
jgi:uncharacterized delta-60 repeat protein